MRSFSGAAAACTTLVACASLVARPALAFAPLHNVNTGASPGPRRVANGVLPTMPTVMPRAMAAGPGPAVDSEEMGIADPDPDDPLLAAVSRMDDSGSEMDEAATDAAFWAVVEAVDRAEAADAALPAAVPRMLHHIFDADMRHLAAREQLTTNVTCMQPKEEGLTSAAQMNYIFDDSSHKDLPLTEGRRCEDGRCCDACSRSIFPTFATEAECSLETFPDMASLTFNNLETVSTAAILQFVRLVERVRRSIAREYGLPLATVLPLQA
eukprot:CAMPEP_0181050762 /NCGR_PEP_ID=MMETSP1070-20121207/16690_1 /TAXON_ID=265543 /ORGANISM="Minutocellus polymorphus, Strain NH13" /LENGTH=267 /DNA_ID=CAMNT_0023129731 /DNA_START=19 /DNA_END=819 /DNA_ORIENTATION=+